MASNSEEARPTGGLPDPAALAAVLVRIFSNSIDAARVSAEKLTSQSRPQPFDLHAPARSFGELLGALWSNPTFVLSAQHVVAREWTELWSNATARLLGHQPDAFIEPEKGDRRFNDAAWRDPFFDNLKQAYLLTTRQVLELVSKSDLDQPARIRADFYARQYLNALSPANFAFTNPEAIKKAVETGGLNLLSGFANILADVASPSGLVKRRSADNFELGVDIAATPGSIIFQNEMMQLIQYEPATEQVNRRPLVYVPPLVNKFYVLDLQPKSSLIKWLVDEGYTVFVISWVNPDARLSDKGISDYIKLGPIAALDVIESATGERSVDAFGFCMGGTLLAMTAAYLAARNDVPRFHSISMIGTLLDFADTGEWSTFYEPAQMNAFERHVSATGVVSADKLQALFSVVRANDLIWASVVNHYLLDRTAPASDLLFWFADGSRIPQAFLLEYGKLLLIDNRLKQAGGIVIDDVALDLNQIKTPVCLISLKDDHVSGWAATYEGAKLFGGSTTFLLGGSGHNAGVINPPAARKHGYWSNDALPGTADQWLAGAEKHEGSWWPAWQAWLARNGDEKVPARSSGCEKWPILEPAPGSYVRVK